MKEFEEDDLLANELDDGMNEEIQPPKSVSVIAESSKMLQRINPENANKLLQRTLNLTDDNIYHEPTCPICNSPHRKEIENLYAKSPGDYAPIEAYVLTLDPEETKNKINNSVIENHIKNHHQMAVAEIRKKEFVNRIKRLDSGAVSTLEKLSMTVNMLFDRLATVNSLSPTSDLSLAEVEKIKSGETAKLGAAIAALLKQQSVLTGELKETGDLITIPKQEFMRIFQEIARMAKTENEQKLVRKFFQSLASSKVVG